MTFKGHSKPWAMSFFIRSPGFSVRGRKCRLGTYVHLFMTTIEVIKKTTTIAAVTSKVVRCVIYGGTVQWATYYFVLVVCTYIHTLYRAKSQ